MTAPPKIGIAIHTRLTEPAVEAIEDLARREDTTRAEMIRVLLDEALSYRARKAARRVGK